MDANFHHTFVAHARRSGRTVHLDPDVSWVNVAPAAWPSLVFGARFEPQQTEQRVRDLIRLMEKGQAPRHWFIGPTTRPPDLGASLERLGFVKASESSAMAVDLLRMNDSFRWPPGLTITRVDNHRELRQWTRVLVHVMFQGGHSEAEEFYHLVEGFGPASDDAGFYLGLYEGQPVATTMCFLADGIAGIYHVTTLPEFRNRGIGKRVVLAPLLDARDRGYRAGSLFASELGSVIYRQIGFEAQCSVSTYRLGPEFG
jgi:GNAT superfamily N-acetyltransferase